jgi:hypothetical protein
MHRRIKTTRHGIRFCNLGRSSQTVLRIKLPLRNAFAISMPSTKGMRGSTTFADIVVHAPLDKTYDTATLGIAHMLCCARGTLLEHTPPQPCVQWKIRSASEALSESHQPQLCLCIDTKTCLQQNGSYHTLHRQPRRTRLTAVAPLSHTSFSPQSL